MADYYNRGFSFNSGDLGVKLADFDHRVDDWVDSLKESTAADAEVWMYDNAPWQNRTWDARTGLWAKSYGDSHKGGIRMGHSVKYGVYLEEYHGGRFEIIMPAIVHFGDAFMNALQGMFAKLEARLPATPIAVPGEGRTGTSQNAETVTERRTVTTYHDERGRFTSAEDAVRTSTSYVLKKTKVGANKVRNAAKSIKSRTSRIRGK